MTYTVPIGLRVPLDLLQQIDKKVTERKFTNRTDAVLSYIQMGIHVESFKASIKDPEFLKHIDELKQGNQLFEWAETLKDNERDAIASALQFVKESKFSQHKFI